MIEDSELMSREGQLDIKGPHRLTLSWTGKSETT